ncbi:Grx4 family monothiol glutaredoxin [Myxococcota bacterium]|nr:Grx4 family monothiol glutaredoxin [Myxococcota bacterium]
MSQPPPTDDQIRGLIDANDVMLFMKGNRGAPQCGFSATVVGILDTLVADYGTFDVLSNPDIRDGIKEFSAWPTIPQLYIRGEFVGGCDIVQEAFSTGELHQLLGIEVGEVTTPTLHVSDEAAEALRQATANTPPDRTLHLRIDAQFQSSLLLEPVSPNDIEVTGNGIRFHLDTLSASRAEGLRIDVAETPEGRGFRIDNPNAPHGVGQLSVDELKRKLDANERFEFIDVRTPEERATASIPGTTLLTSEVANRLAGLPKDTPMVFHCHHGSRSRAAADEFVSLGFTNVWNLEGGIEAWSLNIDPSVPRY